MTARLLVSFVAGLMFASGLSIAGMTRPDNIIGFLDLHAWNPALLGVMGSAVVVFSVAFRLIMRRSAPVLGGRFEIPTSRAITWQLVVGAAAFGVGWGLAGYCGGPALASLLTGQHDVLIFVLAMLAGTALAARLPAG